MGSFHHHVGIGLVAVVVLSLVSATFYGFAAVLQHHEARRQPADLSMRAGLLVNLARRPMWLLASSFDGLGYLFQFLALRRGSLALVEPLLVLSLVVVLPVGAWLDRRRITTPEVLSAAVVFAGLALFMAAARPGFGHPHASSAAWAALTAGIALLCSVSALAARTGPRPRAAVLLAAGSGAAFGYVAAVTERTGHLLDHGVVHALTNWAPYALVIGAVVAMLLTQSAFHSGPLQLSLPTLTIVQPLVAIAIGIGVFGEHVGTRDLDPELEVLGLVVTTLGVFAAARSPVVGGGARKA